ncbi:hypothetical protein HR45_19125 [Shewanella mangrovi]|uniref:Lipoprotein n=1 Tax=Shewanella mangrovi TaxID=1515746 RepID=A0A094J9Q5_9GAMM|nr:hypothetical protein [Shewanella mangrovi]KFZ35962.1 hypothetical protein HR45_19125 [Shewanella mangrovi]
MKVSIVWASIAIILLSGLTACQAETPASSEPAPAPSSTTATSTAPLIPCGSGAPRVDREQIYARLQANGVITPQMTPADAEQLVTQYIQQRQQAYQRCLKGVKP